MLAPFTGLGSALRRARVFHPEGYLYSAQVSSLTPSDAERGAAMLAQRLEGPAIVRISSALWRGQKEWIDALGVAIRFRSRASVPSIVPEPFDQDLLFATIRIPLTLFFAPLKTHWHDFLRNDYYAVSPFFVPGLGKVKFRLCPVKVALRSPTRAERLERAVREGLASFRLEFKHRHTMDWRPLAAVRLERRLPLDQEALRFDPFRHGREIHPIGFVHHLRPAAYWMSQMMRPRRSRRPVATGRGYDRFAELTKTSTDAHRENPRHESGYLRTPLQGQRPPEAGSPDRTP